MELATIENLEHKNKLTKTQNPNQCVVDYIQNDNKTSDAHRKIDIKKLNACIPNDLIIALKQTEVPKVYLGPTKGKLALQNSKPTVPPILKKPDNVWNHQQQRDKFKFLTDQTVCACGAGKDISFLYDSLINKPSEVKPPPSKYDMSAIRASADLAEEKSLNIPDTLVPDEYHIVKSRGVWPLKINEDKFSTTVEDHMNHLTVFPSMKPVGRNEVLQLRHTMDALLNRVGSDTIEEKGPTQLHNLLEIIKQEQDIYNIVFHEIIRQVTIECKERGEVLARLRERYSNLLSRVPRQIKSLHEEVIAQRALDRRLTGELMEFKAKISELTQELTDIREHDKKISDEAHDTHKDLEKALSEAQKNAALLTEYHDLYELQRKRLELQVATLTEEREVWCGACYSIAMKITEENKLNTAKRLNVAERSWSKLARHFAILLSDEDTKIIAEIQSNAEEWREIIQAFRQDLVRKEEETRKTVQIVLHGLRQMINGLTGVIFDSEGNLINIPDQKKCSSIVNDFKYWLELTSREIEKFTGDTVLISEENLKKTELKITTWIELVAKLLTRHTIQGGHTPINHESLFKDIHATHTQFRIRSHGDNGYARALTNFNAQIEMWYQKLYAHVQSFQSEGASKKVGNKMSEAEWVLFYPAFNEMIDGAHFATKFIGLHYSETAERAESAHPKSASHGHPPKVDHDMLLSRIHEWLSSFSHFIESQDACILDEVNKIHSNMIHWMVQIIIRLAPDQDQLSEEARQTIYISSSSADKLVETANKLIAKIETFSKSLISSCSPILQERIVNSGAVIGTLDRESQDLKSLQTECNEWIYAAKLLLAELTDDHSHIEDLSKILMKHSEDNDPEDDKPRSYRQMLRTETVRSDTTQIVRKVSPDVNKLKKQPKEDGSSYEAIAMDQNTERKTLQTVNLTATPESATSITVDNKEAVFNAYKTIEKLQDQLINTEERAQMAEASVSDLEFQLKEALEKIRKLERHMGQDDANLLEDSSETVKSENDKPKLQDAADIKTTAAKNVIKQPRSTKDKALLKKPKK